MNSNNTIVAALRFFRSTNERPGLITMLLLTGISGVFETLPILASLPLLRSLFLGHAHIQLLGHSLTGLKYGALLLLLLLFRFLMGYLSQFYNGKVRTNLMAKFRAQHTASKQERFNYGKKTQALNFLFVGWSQLAPGLIFFFGGMYLMPQFGLTTLLLLLFWLLPLRWIKRNQDANHEQVVALQNELEDETQSDPELWGKTKTRAIHWDAINKNAREFIILTTLILALFISRNSSGISGDASLVAIIMILRGMQQLYTAYIMSQQLSGLRGYFTSSK